jgi:16S rRNA (cytidine1402-2'-O)-methyltransferase
MSDRHTNSLFVVATPIGNIEDITLRALEVLRDVDLIASENVGKTRNLLKRHGIKTTVTSYREANSRRVIPRLLAALESGKNVALVAEAGTPGLSDPGRDLVREVMKKGLRVIPVPGASAAIAAVSVSAMDRPQFIFEGFLPRRGSKRRRRLEELARTGFQLVLFEAPHRLLECLKDMRDVLGDRECLVAREITKMHEEIEKAKVSYFIEKLEENPPRGEFVIVCEGAGAGEETSEDKMPEDKILEDAGQLEAGGRKKRDIAKVLAGKYGLKSSQVYDIIVKGSRRRKGNRSGD